MENEVFKFRSHNNPAAKVIGIILVVNLLAVLYIACAPLFPAFALPFTLDESSVVQSFIILIFVQFSFIRKKDTLNILNDGRIQVVYTGKKKTVIGFTRGHFPRFYLLVSPGLFLDTIRVILESQDSKLQTIVSLDVPKGDAPAVEALNVALLTFGYEKMKDDDPELVAYVKRGFVT
jgi:hypothetical protein